MADSGGKFLMGSKTSVISFVAAATRIRHCYVVEVMDRQTNRQTDKQMDSTVAQSSRLVAGTTISGLALVNLDSISSAIDVSSSFHQEQYLLLSSFRAYSAGALLCPQYVAIRLK